MTKFDGDKFMIDANAAYFYSDGSQRYGQFLMNYLTKHHPEIVVPESADCFYDGNKVKDFLKFIYSL